MTHTMTHTMTHSLTDHLPIPMTHPLNPRPWHVYKEASGDHCKPQAWLGYSPSLVVFKTIPDSYPLTSCVRGKCTHSRTFRLSSVKDSYLVDLSGSSMDSSSHRNYHRVSLLGAKPGPLWSGSSVKASLARAFVLSSETSLHLVEATESHIRRTHSSRTLTRH